MKTLNYLLVAALSMYGWIGVANAQRGGSAGAFNTSQIENLKKTVDAPKTKSHSKTSGADK